MAVDKAAAAVYDGADHGGSAMVSWVAANEGEGR